MNSSQRLNPSAPSPHRPSAPRHILITGGCGFIGTSLVASLIKQGGHYIRILDNLSVGTRKALSEVCAFTELNSQAPPHPRSPAPLLPCLTAPPPFPRPSAPLPHCTSAQTELLVGDIRNYDNCLKACEGIDAVVHLAANTGVGPSVETPGEDMEANVIGVFNMLEAARHNKVKKFIFASSGAPIGECEPPIHEELAPHPVSPYGASKLAGEGYCSAYYRTFGLKTVALRFGNVYGPRSGHKNSVVAKFIRQAMNDEPLEIYGDGSQTRDFIYIDDLIHAITLTLNHSAHTPAPWGEIFQIATYRETTVSEIADAIKALIEKETDRKVNITHGNHRPGDVKRNFSDISKARRILGYEPKYDLSAGLRLTLEYFKGRNQR